MSGTLRFEALLPGGSGWAPVGPLLLAGDDEGSITDIAEAGARHIILFRCDGARSVISRSAGGIDFEAGPHRVVGLLGGREILADLGDGESYERDVTSADLRVAYRARWTHRG